MIKMLEVGMDVVRLARLRMDTLVLELPRFVSQHAEMAREQEVRDAMTGLMTELDVPQDALDGKTQRLVQEEIQQLLILVLAVGHHVLFLLGLQPHQPRLQLPQHLKEIQSQNVSQHVEMVKSNVMKNVKILTKLRMMVAQINASFHMDTQEERQDKL